MGEPPTETLHQDRARPLHDPDQSPGPGRTADASAADVSLTSSVHAVLRHPSSCVASDHPLSLAFAGRRWFGPLLSALLSTATNGNRLWSTSRWRGNRRAGSAGERWAPGDPSRTDTRCTAEPLRALRLMAEVQLPRDRPRRTTVTGSTPFARGQQ